MELRSSKHQSRNQDKGWEINATSGNRKLHEGLGFTQQKKLLLDLCCILSPLLCSTTCTFTFIHILAQQNTSETALKKLTTPEVLCGHVNVMCRPSSMKSKHIICAERFCGLPASFTAAVSFSFFQQGQLSMVYWQRWVTKGGNWRSLPEKGIMYYKTSRWKITMTHDKKQTNWRLQS